MRTLFAQTLQQLTVSFREIEYGVPLPKLVRAQGHLAFRYTEETLEQALVQKLARVISGLGAAVRLLEAGFTQEIFVIERTLDEFTEDIIFLTLPLFGDPRTPLHDQYLRFFYEEEIDASGDAKASPQRRGMVPRQKIRAAIANSPYSPANPSDHIEIHRTLAKAYSGFVHGASPQIMDMVGGANPHFHVSGMLNTPRIAEAQNDLWNYFYRAIHCSLFVSMSLKLSSPTDRIMDFLRYFESESDQRRKTSRPV